MPYLTPPHVSCTLIAPNLNADQQSPHMLVSAICWLQLNACLLLLLLHFPADWSDFNA